MSLEAKQFRRVETLFHEARQLEPAARADFLDRKCGDDLDLRAEVESLLAHVREGASPTQVLLRRDDATLVERGPVSEGPGARIGPLHEKAPGSRDPGASSRPGACPPRFYGTSARSALLSAAPSTAAPSWMPYWKYL